MDDPAADSSLYRGGRFYQMLHGGRAHDLPHYLGLLDERQQMAGGAGGSREHEEGGAAREDGGVRVLELGAGAGRVALPMARRGAVLTAVDASADMLALLRQALAGEPAVVQARVRTLHADVQALALATAGDDRGPRRFELVTCPFNGIAHHHSHAQLAGFFACARRHLVPGGWLAFDAQLPDPSLLRGHRSDVPWFRHPDNGAVCRWTETSRYDPHHQLLQLQGRVRYQQDDRPEEQLDLTLRQLFPQETELLIRHHGFALVRPPLDLQDTLAYVCRLAD